MEDTILLDCPWCNKEIEVNEDNFTVICPHCSKESEVWAEGDAGFDIWYLTKKEG